MSVRIAVVSTDAEYLASDDDAELTYFNDALRGAGFDSEVAVWHEPYDWTSYQALILKSPWDYQLRFEEFSAWLTGLEGRVTILNPPPVVWWNLDKRYLLDLESRGVACVPTRFHDELDTALATLASHGQGRVVIKPNISNGSRNTGLFHADDPAAAALCRDILGLGKMVLISPEIPAITQGGERGLLLFRGEFSHAIAKGPILGLGGVYLGGAYAEQIVPAEVSDAEIALARQVLDVIGQIAAERGWGADAETLLYARIDVVTVPGERPMLLEAELFEPSLFLTTSDGAADRYINALTAQLRDAR